ncbi:MAG TPA: hypothetical protein DCE03_05120, partial [Synergistaceae bacterium]|nr:hypothetical protein [Synergistaceae bacterium]
MERGETNLKLNLRKVNIRNVEWGDKTHVEKGVLYVGKQEI